MKVLWQVMILLVCASGSFIIGDIAGYEAGEIDGWEEGFYEGFYDGYDAGYADAINDTLEIIDRSIEDNA